MAAKPTYEELEQRVTELEKEAFERKRPDERFRENELRLNVAQQVGRIGSWDRNLKTGEVYWSDQNYRIWGYEPQEVTSSFELVKSLIHPDDIQKFLEVRDAALYQKEPYYQEYRINRKDGEIRTVSSIGKVEWNETGKPIRFFGTLQDITEQRRAEEALRESEERFRDLAEGSLLGILIARDFKPLFVNQAYAAMRGYTPEEILSMDSILPLFSLQDQARLVKYKDNRLNRKEAPAVYEYQGVHRDGSLIWLENKVRVIQWEGQPAIQSTIFDISKRKHAEEALKRSEERYRLVFEAASRSGQGAVILQDRDNIEAACIFANEAAAGIIGYTREELSELSWFDILHPHCRDSARDRYRKRISGEDISDIFELFIIRKNGAEVPIELTSIKTEFQGGGALIDFFRDITERKKREEMLLKAKEELEQQVELRTAELKKANKALEVQKKNLEEVNTALRVLLNKRYQDKIEFEEKVLYNVKELIFPYLDKLDNTTLDDTQRTLLGVLESNLNDIISSFSRNLSQGHIGLTPSENEVATLIRQGKTTKQIASLFKLSSRTIETHRRNIRKKLGLENTKTNLGSYLKSMQ